MESTGKKSIVTLHACVVCGESSSQVAVHYSRLLCNGCRAFFKRTVQGKMKITECKLNGECVVNIASRKDCKPCRYQACIKAGVDINKVQPTREFSAEPVGRTRMEEKEDDTPPETSSRMDQPTPVFLEPSTLCHPRVTKSNTNVYSTTHFNPALPNLPPPYTIPNLPPAVPTTNLNIDMYNANSFIHPNTFFDPSYLSTYFSRDTPRQHNSLSLGGLHNLLPPSNNSSISAFPLNDVGPLLYPYTHDITTHHPQFNLLPHHRVKQLSRFDRTSKPLNTIGQSNHSYLHVSSYPYTESSWKGDNPYTIASQYARNESRGGMSSIQSFVTPETQEHHVLLENRNGNFKGNMDLNYSKPERRVSTNTSNFMMDHILHPIDSNNTVLSQNDNSPSESHQYNASPLSTQQSSIKQEIADKIKIESDSGHCSDRTHFQWDSTFDTAETYLKNKTEKLIVNEEQNSTFSRLSPINNDTQETCEKNSSTFSHHGISNTAPFATEDCHTIRKEQMFTSTPNQKHPLACESPELNVVDSSVPSPVDSGDVDSHDDLDVGLELQVISTSETNGNVSTNDFPEPNLCHTDSLSEPQTPSNSSYVSVGVDVSDDGESGVVNGVKSEDSARSEINIMMVNTSEKEDISKMGDISEKEDSGIDSRSHNGSSSIESTTGSSYQQLISFAPQQSENRSNQNLKHCNQITTTEIASSAASDALEKVCTNNISKTSCSQSSSNRSTPRKWKRFPSNENQPLASITGSPKRVKCLSGIPRENTPTTSPFPSSFTASNQPSDRACLVEIKDSKNTPNVCLFEPNVSHLEPNVETSNLSEKHFPVVHTSSGGLPPFHTLQIPKTKDNFPTEGSVTVKDTPSIQCHFDAEDNDAAQEAKGNNRDKQNNLNENGQNVITADNCPAKKENLSSFLDVMIQRIRNAESDSEVENAKKALEGFYNVL